MSRVRDRWRSEILLAAAAAAAAACSAGEPDPSGGAPGKEAAPLGPVQRVEVGARPVHGELSRAAVEYVENASVELGISELDDFAVRQVRTGRGGRRHLRLTQRHQGLRVWGGELVVHEAGGLFVGLNGTVARELEAIDTEPSFAAGRALAIARASVYGARAAVTSRESTALVVYPGAGGARVAWHVLFFNELQPGIQPGLWNSLVDAHTGELLLQFNAIDTLSQASGPGGNRKVSRRWRAELDVEPAGARFAMETARLITVDMAHATEGEGTVVVGPLGEIGDAAINDAHGFAEEVLNTLSEWFGHDSIDDGGLPLRSRVHYGVDYENAFWDGEQMTYGDGADRFHPLSGDVDVVAHEIGHGFTRYHSNLIYFGRSGGNNESFSDIAGTVVEFHREGAAADFDVGRDIMQDDTALRFLCDPPADGQSIDNAEDFGDTLDVHYSSGVMNKAFCRAARRLASGSPTGAATQASVRRAGEAWFEANASYWDESADFTAACAGTLQAATALGFATGEIAAIVASWRDVGVFCDGTPPPIPCDETVVAASGTVTSPGHPAGYPNNLSRTVCIQRPDDQPVTVAFTAFDTEPDYDVVRIRGAGGAELAMASGATAPPPVTSPLIAITFTTDSSLVRSGWSASWGDDGGDDGWSGGAAPAIALVDRGSACSSLTVTGTGSAAAARLDLAGQHTFRSSLRGTLEHNGRVVAVFPPGTFPSGAGPFALTDRSVSGLGGGAGGLWTLCIIDTDGFGDSGVLSTWSVHD